MARSRRSAAALLCAVVALSTAFGVHAVCDNWLDPDHDLVQICDDCPPGLTTYGKILKRYNDYEQWLLGCPKSGCRQFDMTVIAPESPRAWVPYLAKLKMSENAFIRNETLVKALLKFHVLPGVTLSDDSIPNPGRRTFKTLSGDKITIIRRVWDKDGVGDDGVHPEPEFVIKHSGGISHVRQTDIMNSQGMMWIVDGVLEPPAASTGGGKKGGGKKGGKKGGNRKL